MMLDITLIDVLLALMLIILLLILFGMKIVINSIRGIISKTSDDSLSDRAK